MRALITGGYGYLGGHLALSLLKGGWEVVILDNMFKARDWQFGIYRDQLVIHNASIANADVAARAMHGVDVVYHLAARSDWDDSAKHPLRLYHTNVIGTATILNAARAAGVDHVIFTSSAAVYGDVIEAEELGPTMPVNTYGCSKLAAEAVCRGYWALGMSLVVLRLFNVWGGRFCESVVSKFALEPDAKILGDGTQTRDFVYIEDVVRALKAAMNWEPFLYNIGSGVEVTLGGLWSQLREESPVYDEMGRGYIEVDRSCAATESTTERTGWRAKVLLSDLSREEVVRACQVGS